jgi:hypothetical protein
MSLVNSKQELTDAVDEPEECVAPLERIIEEIEVHENAARLSTAYCKHLARLPVMLVAERTADRPAHLIQGFHCFDCARDIAEPGESSKV